MNHITAQIPGLLNRFTIKQPEELVILDALKKYAPTITLAHIKRGYNSITIRLLPSLKQDLLKNKDVILETLKAQKIYLENIY